MTRPADQPDGLRRPLWFKRPLKSDKKAYYLDNIMLTPIIKPQELYI